MLDKNYLEKISKKFNWDTEAVESAVNEFKKCDSVLSLRQRKQFLEICADTQTAYDRKLILGNLFIQSFFCFSSLEFKKLFESLSLVVS